MRRGELRGLGWGLALGTLAWVAAVGAGIWLVADAEEARRVAVLEELGCDPARPFDPCGPGWELVEPCEDGCYECPELCLPGELPEARGHGLEAGEGEVAL